ncbi:MAG: oxidoreductase [Subtercola sp.]|nr:oxidoreductase [Subtercola sp.]
MRICVVTGAGRGIGLAIAERLHRDGGHVVIVDQQEEPARAAAASVEGTAHVADIGDEASVSRLATLLRDQFGRVDVLVNNAGFWGNETFDEMTEAGARRIFDVNVLGTWRMTQKLVPLMPPGGAVINLASIAADCPPANAGLYPATKGAVMGLTRQFAVQLGSKGIRVNAVSPGLIRTPASEVSYVDGARDRFLAQLPVPRTGLPEDVADAVAFLASDQARYITGEILRVDGGLVIAGPGERRA